MRVRRMMLGVGVTLAVLVVTTQTLSAQTTVGTAPRLFFQTSTGVAAYDVQRSESSLWARDARPAGDWSVLVSASDDGDTTKVASIAASDGAVLGEFPVDAPAHVRVVSFRGDQVVLSPHAPGRDGRQPGRSRTTLVVAATDGTDTRTYDLAGNIEPEAFSTDGRALFVIEYLPPQRPDRYQVRRLDLVSGALGEVASPDGAAQGQMPGVARTQVMAPDGSRLYTLYTSSHGGTHDYSFVHVLDLDEQWAHCVDLPRPFGATPEAMGITVAPDGGEVFVADTAAGRLATVPTDALLVDRVARLSVRGHRAPAQLAADDQHVYVGSGRTLLAVLRSSLVLRYHAALRSPVEGLVVPSGSPMLYVAQRRALDALDVRTGSVQSSVPVALGRLAGTGASSVPLSGDTVKCAC